MKMNSKRCWLPVVIVVVAIGFFVSQCTSSSPMDIVGNGTGTGAGNPLVIGTVYDPSTKKPSKNAFVKLRKAGYLKDKDGNNNDLQLMRDVLTNEFGQFRFDDLDTGSYSVEVSDDEMRSLLFKFDITSNSDTQITKVDTLKEPSQITGSVKTTTGKIISSFIQVYGLDRLVSTESDGSFSITVPPGNKYTLVIIPENCDKEVHYEYETDVIQEKESDDLGVCSVEDGDAGAVVDSTVVPSDINFIPPSVNSTEDRDSGGNDSDDTDSDDTDSDDTDSDDTDSDDTDSDDTDSDDTDSDDTDSDDTDSDDTDSDDDKDDDD
jgi:hypothetical protein